MTSCVQRDGNVFRACQRGHVGAANHGFRDSPNPIEKVPTFWNSAAGPARLESSKASSDYIQLWDGNTETLAASLSRIRGAAVEIIGPLLSAEQQTPALIAAMK